MLFNSYIFILLFLPLCLAGYFVLRHFKLYNPALVFLVGMSLWFYGYANPSYLPIIVVSILVNYFVYYFMGLADKKNKAALKEASASRNIIIKKVLLILGIIFNLSLLGYFKYMNFFIENINAVFKSDISLLNIALPLGISFFTFQQVSFVVDAYKGEVEQCNFIEYACFVSFFPQLIAGPIVSHDEIIPQFKDEAKSKPCWENLSSGFFVFTIGLAKKVLLADTFGTMADSGFGNVLSAMNGTGTNLNASEAIIVLAAYSFQLYLDFSGYCDMATGIGRMMNIDLPLNFNSPYKALNMDDMWKRWHITLTRFFTKYVYIPLGGSRKGKIRTYLNILIIFIISGFWHGANWTYIIWGTLNGVFIVLYRLLKKYIDKIPKVINHLITIILWNLSLVVFRSSSVNAVIEYFKRLFSFEFGGIRSSLYTGFLLPEFEKIFSIMPFASYASLICMIVFFIITTIIVFFCRNTNELKNGFKAKTGNAVFIALLFIWCVLSLGGVSIFLYFNF